MEGTRGVFRKRIYGGYEMQIDVLLGSLRSLIKSQPDGWQEEAMHEIDSFKKPEQPDDCREAFEKWHNPIGKQGLERDDNGHYRFMGVQHAWMAFQAAWNLRHSERESVSIEAAKKAMGVLEWIANHDFVPQSSIDSAKAFCMQAPMMAKAGYNALRNEIEDREGA